MRALLRDLVADRFLASIRSLSLAVIYDDTETHRKATNLYEFLLQELDEQGQLTATWWRTSLLGDPKLSRAAARAIAGAEVIVLSVNAEKSPTVSFVQWMESWPVDGAHSTVLVAIMVGDEGEAGKSWDLYLREWSNRRRIAYFPGLPFEIVPNGTSQNLTRSKECSGRAPRPIDPYQHWGLNE